MKPTILFLAIYIFLTGNAMAQTDTVDGSIYTRIVVGNKIYLQRDNPWCVFNKSLKYTLENQNQNIAEHKMQEAMSNLKLRNSNQEVLSMVQSVFSPAEIARCKDESILMLLRINNQGKIFYIRFLSGASGHEVKNISLDKYSLLEDKIMATLNFYIPDTSITYYTIGLPLKFKNITDSAYVFSKGMYLVP